MWLTAHTASSTPNSTKKASTKYAQPNCMPSASFNANNVALRPSHTAAAAEKATAIFPFDECTLNSAALPRGRRQT